MITPTVIVVGGGAAGLMAAVHAARMGASVTVFERNERCARKLRITGKGRCNVTNAATRDAFFENIPTNPRFMYSAWSRFSSNDTMAFFEAEGVPLKVERGNRVFPVSDSATDVVDALVTACRAAGVEIRTGVRVTGLWLENGRLCGVRIGERCVPARAVVVATGGLSYPLTGSTGDGYRMATEAGLSLVPTRPSLVPLEAEGDLCARLQGLSLRNVALTLVDTHTGKTVFTDFGEMLFTHFGITGPLVLSASAHLAVTERGRYTAEIDLKPALDEKTLDARLLSDFEKYKNRDFLNALGDLLPQKLIEPIVEMSGIDPRKKVNAVTREERRALLGVLKKMPVRIKGTRPVAEAIITKGGVDTKGITPATMQAKCCKNLFFAGEVLDVDAYTGGFNLQIAFSTAVLAGENAAFAAMEEE